MLKLWHKHVSIDMLTCECEPASINVQSYGMDLRKLYVCVCVNVYCEYVSVCVCVDRVLRGMISVCSTLS